MLARLGQLRSRHVGPCVWRAVWRRCWQPRGALKDALTLWPVLCSVRFAVLTLEEPQEDWLGFGYDCLYRRYSPVATAGYAPVPAVVTFVSRLRCGRGSERCQRTDWPVSRAVLEPGAGLTGPLLANPLLQLPR